MKQITQNATKIPPGCWKPELALMSNKICVIELFQFEEAYANVNLQEVTVTLQEATGNYNQLIGSNSPSKTSAAKSSKFAKAFVIRALILSVVELNDCQWSMVMP